MASRIFFREAGNALDGVVDGLMDGLIDGVADGVIDGVLDGVADGLTRSEARPDLPLFRLAEVFAEDVFITSPAGFAINSVSEVVAPILARLGVTLNVLSDGGSSKTA